MKRYFAFVLPIIISALVLIIFSSPEKDVLHNEDLVIFPYNDHESGGNSTISYSVSETGEISYNFVTGDSIKYPYAGVMIYKKDSSYFDFSPYNTIRISMKAETGKSVPFYVFTNIKDYSNWDTVSSFLNMQTFIPSEDAFKVFDISFSSFFIPNWWYDAQSTKINSVLKPNYSQVAILNFANFGNVRSNIVNTVFIDGIWVRKDMTYYYIVISILLPIYYSFLFILSYYSKKHQENNIINKYITFSYKKIELKEEHDHASSIFEYINNNYSNPELSIADLKQETGLMERKISDIIKDETNLSFKQYINTLRLTEAKRLLKESNLQISEIAYKIGYGNVSHFNRVFKSIENSSPSEYRHQNTQ